MSVPEFQSKKVKKKGLSGLSSDRYRYFSLSEAEPELGDPLVGPSSIGAKPYPQQDAYILASFGGTENEPSRYWVAASSLSELGLGLVPGGISVRDEGVLVGSATSFTTLNFVGAGVTVDYVGSGSSEQTGIATVRISSAAAGDLGYVQYRGPIGFLSASSGFVYDELTGNVGIGTNLITERLHVAGVGTLGKVKADAFVSRPELITGTATLLPGETIDLYSQLGRIRSGYITVNRISCPDNTGLTTSLIDTLISTRFTTQFINATGVTTSANLVSTSFQTVNENVTGISTVNRQSVTNSVIGLATITNLVSTNQNFSGITTIFNSSINRSVISISSITNANIGVSTIGIATISFSNVGVSTVGRMDAISADVNFLYAGIATVGFASITNTVIGIATVGTLIADNVSLQGTGSFSNISIGNTLTAASVAATDITVYNRIGIKTTASYELDVNGDARFRGVVYASNGRGNSGEVLTSQGPNPAIWAPASNVTVGAANSVSFTNTGNDQLYNIAFTSAVDDIGYARIDNGNLTYNPSTNRLGIGNTIPAFNLDVVGNVNFTGTLFQNGDIYVASNWGKNFVTGDIYKLGANVGVGTSVLSSAFTVSGTSEFRGNVAIGTSYELQVFGDSRLSGYAHFEGAVTENVSNGFSSEFVPSSGVLTIDTSNSTVAVGILTTTVTTWNFINVNTESSKSITITLIIDSSSLITYGENCNVNGTPISGGVRWPGGIAPIPTDNEDIVSFAIVKDSSGTVRVYGSASLNFS